MLVKIVENEEYVMTEDFKKLDKTSSKWYI